MNNTCTHNAVNTCPDYPEKCSDCGAHLSNAIRKESPVSLWPWLLITVKEREIETEQFKTYQEAFDHMLEELGKEFVKADIEQQWEEIKASGFKPVEYCECGFTPLSAWSNLDNNCNYDWKIVSVM